MADPPAEVKPTAESIASYVKKHSSQLKKGMMMHGPMLSVREEDYQGHHILIRTTYEIEVDGQPLMGHIDLSNEGQIAYHGLPNMSFDSAVDLVEPHALAQALQFGDRIGLVHVVPPPSKTPAQPRLLPYSLRGRAKRHRRPPRLDAAGGHPRHAR